MIELEAKEFEILQRPKFNKKEVFVEVNKSKVSLLPLTF